MFAGSSNTSLDSKNRFILPAKFRKFMNSDEAGKFMLNRGMGGCIDVYTLSAWKAIEDKLKVLDPFDPKAAKFKRIFLYDANECEIDGQFRMLVPQSLLDFAKIEKDLIVVGMAEKIEIWNPEIYRKYIEISDEELEVLTKDVMGVGLNV